MGTLSLRAIEANLTTWKNCKRIGAWDGVEFSGWKISASHFTVRILWVQTLKIEIGSRNTLLMYFGKWVIVRRVVESIHNRLRFKRYGHGMPRTPTSASKWLKFYLLEMRLTPYVYTSTITVLYFECNLKAEFLTHSKRLTILGQMLLWRSVLYLTNLDLSV